MIFKKPIIEKYIQKHVIEEFSKLINEIHRKLMLAKRMLVTAM